jgi:hypothetical protein
MLKINETTSLQKLNYDPFFCNLIQVEIIKVELNHNSNSAIHD